MFLDLLVFILLVVTCHYTGTNTAPEVYTCSCVLSAQLKSWYSVADPGFDLRGGVDFVNGGGVGNH